jgi:hypothetical protein
LDQRTRKIQLQVMFKNTMHLLKKKNSNIQSILCM